MARHGHSGTPPTEGNKTLEATHDAWLAMASEAFEVSTSFVENNYRETWENNLRLFKNKHEKGSKYNKAAYKFRSRGFRPKTRSFVRQNEAAPSRFGCALSGKPSTC